MKSRKRRKEGVAGFGWFFLYSQYSTVYFTNKSQSPSPLLPVDGKLAGAGDPLEGGQGDVGVTGTLDPEVTLAEGWWTSPGPASR